MLLMSAAAIAEESRPSMHNVRELDGGFTLAAGPNVEGVVFLRQFPEEGRYSRENEWPADVYKAFHAVPWIDAASIRIRWANLEPAEGQFNWHAVDRVLEEVKAYNQAHPGAKRTLHIRVMGGVHCPDWLEKAGVKYYQTSEAVGHGTQRHENTIRIPMPYDNPEFLKQLRRVYRAMYERYKDEPLVTVYHGSWSAGPWDEIFHPQGAEPLPPDYTPEKFVKGMIEQLDVLIEEFCLKGKVAELPFSGKYPQKSQIDITGPLAAHAVERLGRRSPFLYFQTNGWGMTNTGVQTTSWGHERDIDDAYGLVNLAFQALGTNSGGMWMPQGDWAGLVSLAEKFEVAYTELYPPDFMPVDTKHHMVEAFTAEEGGFRPWLKKRGRILYVREGTVRQIFAAGGHPRALSEIAAAAAVPESTWVKYRARTRKSGGEWSEWKSFELARELPPGDEAEIEATLHTDDGYFTPRVILMEPVWSTRAAR
jgi:hypothetical protein